MNDLTKLLEAFHISTRAQKAAKQANSARQQHAQSHLDVRVPPPMPEAGTRPCWEPPIFDYTFYGNLVEAQKEYNMRQGSKDVGFITDIMDSVVEKGLLNMYQESIMHLNLGGEKETSAEHQYWEALAKNLEEDMKEVDHDLQIIRARQGTTWREKVETMFRESRAKAGIIQTMIERDGGLKGKWSKFVVIGAF